MRILVTGSRSWTDTAKIAAAILDVITQAQPEDLALIHGACPMGADALADRWWQGTIGPDSIVRYKADWDGLGRRAGIERNRVMVNDGEPDVVLAFVMPCRQQGCKKGAGVHASHGTDHCISYARSKHIPVIVYRDGFI